MNYNELKNITKSKKIDLKDVAKEIGMKPYGFRLSIENGTLPISKVSELCRMLGISPNEFFGWPDQPGGIVAQNIGGDNHQNAGKVMDLLAEQLREKDRQIAELIKALKK